MQAKALALSFVNSQFNYCAILWMFCGRKSKLRLKTSEVFKSENKLNPQFLRCFFENHEIPYSLKCGSVVKLPGTNTTKYGINSLNFRGAIL